MHLVIVESPAKARIIGDYLGKDYHVIASYGHVRDIDIKDKKAVDPENQFNIIWSKSKNKKSLDVIKKQSLKAESIILATDPDREGEAIAWHIAEVIKSQKCKEKPIKRIAFHSITKKSITDAIINPGEINMALVEAYLTRRALDYLVGFSLSPVLWRKLPGARSAGRVQSATLRIITKREEKRDIFKKQRYWTFDAHFSTEKKKTFSANLHLWKEQKISKTFPQTDDKVQHMEREIKKRSFHIETITSKENHYHPSPPLITSTLQQEAHNQLGFSAIQTMQIAQKLYEKGHITYMRTDNINLSPESLENVRAYIMKKFGKEYLSEKVRYYKGKVRNAQEAHEAIRPTNFEHTISHKDQATEKLYRLIHTRTIASQMSSARVQKIQVQVCDEKKEAFFHANGEHRIFDGFLRLIPRKESSDLKERMAIFSLLEKEMSLTLVTLKPQEHWTEPPSRFTEASIIKYLEERGIGRPSTYAGTISTLKERGYIEQEKKALFPTDHGRLVSCFLSLYFDQYVDEQFTASMEEKLDTISKGEEQRLRMLTSFWKDFDDKIQSVQKIEKRDILEAFNSAMAHYAFGVSADGKPSKNCPKCAQGLSIKTGKNGVFIGCSTYPDCRYTRHFNSSGEEDHKEKDHADIVLGKHPQTKMEVLYKVGPYGPYVQTTHDKVIKRVSIPSNMRDTSISLEQGVLLLELPRKIGVHPTSGKDVFVGIGKYGTYVRCEHQYGRLDADEDIFSIGLNRAIPLLEKKKHERKITAIRLLGKHPDDQASVEVFEGRYGFYVHHAKINASLKDERMAQDITLKQALPLLEKASQRKGIKKTKTKIKKSR